MRAPAPASPRVLVVSQRLDIGGTERHLVRVLPELRRRGIDVSLFVLARGGALEAELQTAGVAIAGPPAGPRGALRIVPEIWHLARHLRRHRPDVVHFFLPEPYIAGTLASLVAGPQRRIMSRRSLATYRARRPLLALIEPRLHRFASALVGNSEAVAKELRAECGDARKVGLIHNGIVLPAGDDRAPMRAALGLAADTFVLAIVANLIPYKGHGDLLAALGRARDALPQDWRLLVIGRDDGIGAALRRQAAALGIAPHIVWLGERPDAERIVGAADIALLSSHEEGFSNSLIEAMARGIPVIATAVGGNLDAVQPEGTGVLVPVASPADLAGAILRLAGDGALRRRLGGAARERAARLFSLDACVDRYVSLYRGYADLDAMPAQAVIERGAPAATEAVRP